LSDVQDEVREAESLKRDLSLRDLTALGIAAIIGAGIFSTIGNAAADGGPAISLLFVFTAVACGFSALCYAEFASKVPISGSAYTYAYYSFGELIAWIIGWDLLLEYAIGNVVVAISWSDYFTQFINGFGFRIPQFLTIDYYTAFKSFKEASILLGEGNTLESLSATLQEGYIAWQLAPQIGSFRMIADFPALLIVIVVTAIVFIGIKESKLANNIIVAIKLVVVFAVIVIGSFYVNPDNWNPFAPNGIAGVLKGVSAVFFAYIGFDAISTTAEECKNPTRDLPRAIIYTLVICSVLYVFITLVLTGMIHFSELRVGDPLAFVFQRVGLNRFSGIIALTAIIVMAGVLLVFQIGQPRIWMSMSRDGLLPKAFSRIHPRYKTPSFSTIIAGIVVGIPALCLNLTVVTDLTAIGTLFAFLVVCGGVLIGRDKETYGSKEFRVPYVNGKYIVPLLIILAFGLHYFYDKRFWYDYFNFSSEKLSSGLVYIWEKIPMLIFLTGVVVVGVLSYLKDLSLIPVLGLLSCLFLMTKLSHTNWMIFTIWLLIGLVVYFSYSMRNSKMNNSDGFISRSKPIIKQEKYETRD